MTRPALPGLPLRVALAVGLVLEVVAGCWVLTALLAVPALPDDELGGSTGRWTALLAVAGLASVGLLWTAACVLSPRLASRRPAPRLVTTLAVLVVASALATLALVLAEGPLTTLLLALAAVAVVVGVVSGRVVLEQSGRA